MWIHSVPANGSGDAMSSDQKKIQIKVECWRGGNGIFYEFVSTGGHPRGLSMSAEFLGTRFVEVTAPADSHPGSAPDHPCEPQTTGEPEVNNKK